MTTVEHALDQLTPRQRKVINLALSRIDACYEKSYLRLEGIQNIQEIASVDVWTVIKC